MVEITKKKVYGINRSQITTLDFDASFVIYDDSVLYKIDHSLVTTTDMPYLPDNLIIMERGIGAFEHFDVNKTVD